MSMKISEAMSIIEDAGLLLERIKKYRTTGEERKFRDIRSDYDRDAIKEKMWKITREEDMERYVNGIGFTGDERLGNQKIWVEFRGIGSFGNMLVERLSKAVGADGGYHKEMLYFNFEEVRKQSQTKNGFVDILRKFLYDRFGVPYVAFLNQVNYGSDPDSWLDNAKKNYDIIEKYVEDEQYGGIHDLNYREYIQAIKDAQAAVNSPDNVDKFVTNQYGFRKRMEVIYAKFRKFCRLFKREFERQRGNLTKPAEV